MNVGCIPKKLFHIAAQSHESVSDSESLGWQGGSEHSHSWETLRNNVQGYIKSLNFGYNSTLSSLGIDFINSRAFFKDANTVQFEYKPLFASAPTKHELRAENILIATGTRPRLYPGVPADLSITSDDIFTLQ